MLVRKGEIENDTKSLSDMPILTWGDVFRFLQSAPASVLEQNAMFEHPNGDELYEINQVCEVEPVDEIEGVEVGQIYLR